MANDLTFYTNPMSRGRIVRWMLEEVGAPYETVVMGYGTSRKDAAYLAINPVGKVPTIRHGDAVVTEAAAICAYLADAFPHASLAPQIGGGKERAAYYRWMFFAAGPVEAAVTNRALGVTVPEGRDRMVGYGSFDAVMDALERAVSGSHFIAGESFSAADVYVGSQIGFGLQFGSFDKRPAFEAYVARLSERPAFLRAQDIDNKLMAEMQATH